MMLGLVLTVGCQGFNLNPKTDKELEQPKPSMIEGLELKAKTPQAHKFNCALRAQLGSQFGPDALNSQNFEISKVDLMEASAEQDGLLRDEFRNHIIDPIRANPANADCVAREVENMVDRKSVAGMIKSAAALNEIKITVETNASTAKFEDILDELCAGECSNVEGELAPEFASSISPLLAAIQHGLNVRYENVPGGAQWWRDFGGNGLLLSVNEPGYNPSEPSLREVLNADRGPQYAAAAQIAAEVQNLDMDALKKWENTRFAVRTPYGWIRINGAEANHYGPETEETLLLIDLGGDDVHLDQVASNQSGANAVSIVIDVEGNDRYEIPQSEYAVRSGGQDDSPSLSNHFAQGAARYGIAMLFDIKGNDRYESLRGSQGYAHFGVGVLYDGEGNDEYISEAASQGAAQFGIALAIDAGQGNDSRFSYTLSQGFGYVDAVGILHDDGGDDEYICNVGNPDFDGKSLYPSPQLKNQSNVSLCQGAGFGLRSTDANIALSGGIGILRDARGDDRYEASVYAQGTGYWQGTGMLLDGQGFDSYDAQYYAQGAGVHFAQGIFIDQGQEDDQIGTIGMGKGFSLGVGHDFGIGVHVNEAGNDVYVIEKYSGGGTSCNGRGLFLEFAGNDTYEIKNVQSLGVGNAGECSKTRQNAPSIGVMIDAEGEDNYFSEVHNAGNDRVWNRSSNELSSEIGIGQDSNNQEAVMQLGGPRSQSRTR